jgi:tetratricopeptide (TPR) repeat protein
MSPRSICAAAALAVLTLAAPARASDFWQRAVAEVSEPTDTEPTLDELIDQGIELSELALLQAQVAFDMKSIPREYRTARARMKEAADLAVRKLEQALERDPDNADVHLLLGTIYYDILYQYYEDDLPLSARHDEVGLAAIEHFNAFERLAPEDPRRTNFARGASNDNFGGVPFVRSTYQFKRSIVYTKLGGDENYENALVDYDYLMAVTPRGLVNAEWTANVLTNSAEILMALGRLDDAIERYQAGIEYRDDALYHYGLAVALDRAGQTETALEHMRLGAKFDGYLAGDGTGSQATFASLAKETVFFIPDGEIHYYYGLGYEALGETAQAVSHFKAFLRAVPDSRYRKLAEDHLQFLRGSSKKRK